MVLGTFDTPEQAAEFIAANRQMILEKGLFIDPHGYPVALYPKS
jgi:hypothetical protein